MNRKYICPWCGHNFEQDVRYLPKQTNPNNGQPVNGMGKKSAISTQVVCPKCMRLIPTFKKELTGNIVGQKHIHLRG